MPLRIIRNDISKVSADAIVNSANPMPICGGGAEFHIYNAAGHAELLAAREKIGPLDVAEIAVTPAFALNAKYIIHTVGPVWNGGKSGEFLVLANCYRGALEKAKELGCTSIAFPLISSGVYRFPKDSALKIALTSINEFLQANEMDVMLVVFDRKAFEVSEELSDDIQSFINDNYVQDRRSEVLGYVRNRWNARSRASIEEFNELCDLELEEPRSLNLEESCEAPDESDAESCLEKNSFAICDADGSLEDIIAKTGETFCDKLFSLIREKKQDDVEIYKKANLDRKHFSKIRSNVNYRPTKKTALALAIALKLNLEETNDLLARAELALSPANKGDLIVIYFINHQKYDIWELNSMLFKFGQPTLGA